MLTEEAHHMFVGETGLSRVVKRSLEVMKELGSDDPARIRAAGAVDLPLLQNISTSGARPPRPVRLGDLVELGCQFRPTGSRTPGEHQYEDHALREQTLNLSRRRGLRRSMLNALNEVMRESYLKDCRDRAQALEPLDRARRLAVAPEPAVSALPALHRRLGGTAGGPSRKPDAEGAVMKNPLPAGSRAKPTRRSCTRSCTG